MQCDWGTVCSVTGGQCDWGTVCSVTGDSVQGDWGTVCSVNWQSIASKSCCSQSTRTFVLHSSLIYTHCL